MNLKTTLTLLFLAVAGGAFWIVTARKPADRSESDTLKALREIRADQVDHLVINRGKESELELQRTPGGAWILPGGWPTRHVEVHDLIETLVSGLRSRFAPEAVADDAALTDFGLDPSSPERITVEFHQADRTLHLTLGRAPEKKEATNKYSRPTMLRLEPFKEVVTLAPNLITVLSRPADYYRQRRLFTSDVVKADEFGSDHTEQLSANALNIAGPKSTFALKKHGRDWELAEPVRDHVDPDKLKSVLAAVPDLWADLFVSHPSHDLSEYELDKAKQTIQVTKPTGETVTLLIGKESRTKARTVIKPPPPGPPGMPREPLQETVHDKYHYAKLRNNSQIFEIKADKLDSIFVAADTLRDARLARFRTEDARRLEMTYGGQELVLAKDKDKWKVEKPFAAEADTIKINEILDKLTGLQAKDKDVQDKSDLKAENLSPPAGTIKVAVEETKGQGDSKTTTKKSFTFLLGKDDADKAKLAIQVEGLPRVNLVDDSLVALLRRPALTYRGRRVLDFSSADLAQIEIQGESEKFGLKQDKGIWRLASPVDVEADASKTERLADDLGRLEVVEYVTNEPKADDLDKTYGLAKPALTATLAFSKKDNVAQTLQIGKQRGDKNEYFAKLASGPAVFVVRKDIRDEVDKGSLAYRKLRLWETNTDDVSEIRYSGGQNYRLKREGKDWKIVEPFEAPTMAKEVDPLVRNLTVLAADHYEAHAPKDLAKYGLDKPSLRLEVVPIDKKPSTEKTADTKTADKPKSHVLLVGKATAEGAKSRFAKLETDPAVFVVSDQFLTAVDRPALALLDRKPLSLDLSAITKITSKGAGDSITLHKDKDAWQVESPSGKFAADRQEMAAFLQVWSSVQADSIAAYGAKVDWAAFGLDKPKRRLTVTLAEKTAGEGKPAKADEHVLAVGKDVSDHPGQVYARLDNGPGVLVLNPSTAKELQRLALDFADRGVWKFNAAQVTSIERKHGADDLHIAKHDADWQITKPGNLKADTPTVESLLDDLSSLCASRVAAFAPKDLKPFGLDKPEATITVQFATDAKPPRQVLLIGAVADAKTGDRYARADGTESVGVISKAEADRLLAAPLQFRDRNLAHLAEVDRVTMDRDTRNVVFTKTGGIWKMTSPVENDCEEGDLETFVKALGKLRADEFVAEKPKDRKPYGLDKPAIRWRLQAGDKRVLDLLVGSHEKVNGAGKPSEGPRLYARLGTGDLVFLLAPNLSQQAVAEYRSRNLLAPLDTAQVSALNYRYRNNPFSLEQQAGSWHAIGKPDAKIISATVSETLDALARLKPERYIVDKDADSKLYGLEPPELALEIVSPNGKKALHVGRQEGESHKYYAKLWAGNHDAVFLISEEDAKLIVRDLTAFTKPPTKKLDAPRPGSSVR